MFQEKIIKKIKIPKNVNINLSFNKLEICGRYGKMFLEIQSKIDIKRDNMYLIISSTNNINLKKKLGLYYSLLNNYIKGVSQGFKLNLFLKGIGYKVFKIENKLKFKLGYSHEIFIIIPKDIDIKIFKSTHIIMSSFNWELLTQFAYKIKKLKRIDPYKGKGIFFKNETTLQKEGKKNK